MGVRVTAGNTTVEEDHAVAILKTRREDLLLRAKRLREQADEYRADAERCIAYAHEHDQSVQSIDGLLERAGH